MPGKKNIILIIPELTMGGAQRSLTKLSIELAKHHQVWIVVFNKKNPIAYIYGGELLSLDVVSGKGMFLKFRAFIQRITRLRKLKKQHGIELSISFLEGADYVNILSRSNEKIILSIRGSKHHDETMVGKFFWLRNKILIPWLYRKADLIVTVNKGIVAELQQYGLHESKCITIGNFYDRAQIEKLSMEQKTDGLNILYRDPVLITTGRLAPEKGLPSLIRIFHRLKKNHPRLRFVIVGGGPLFEELVGLCEELKLTTSTSLDFTESPDVLFAGNQTNVFKFLRGAEIYLMNSSSEGFPNGMAEAMICRVPVMSSDCPYGPREILAPELPYSTSVVKPYVSQNGILMPMIKSPSDDKMWVEMLDGLLGKNELLLQLAEKAGKRVDLFNEEFVLSQWHKALE